MENDSGVEIRKEKDHDKIQCSVENLVIKKPRKDLDDLFGAWKGLSDAELKEMRKAWGRWNAKAIGKL